MTTRDPAEVLRRTPEERMQLLMELQRLHEEARRAGRALRQRP